MGTYVLRRLLQVIPVFFGATLLIYFMVFAMPGDPIQALFGERQPSPAVLERIREQYNLDEPFFVQYLLYVADIFRLDFGTSFSGQPVGEVLVRAFPVTLRLAAYAIVVSFLLAVVIGLFSALRKGGVFDNTALLVSLGVMAVPAFVMCYVAQFVFGISLGWFPPTVGANTTWFNLTLPALTLAVSIYATSMRLTRASTIETLGQDWVRTAYSKGLPRRRVIPVHVLRNSLLPTVTDMASNFGILMVGATVTEGIFNIPGVGNTLFNAIIRREAPTVVSFVTVFVIVYVLVNLLIDLLYSLLDPRIRYVS